MDVMCWDQFHAGLIKKKKKKSLAVVKQVCVFTARVETFYSFFNAS